MGEELDRDVIRVSFRWLDGVKRFCTANSTELRDAKLKCMDTEQPRAYANGVNTGMNVESMTGYAF